MADFFPTPGTCAWFHWRLRRIRSDVAYQKHGPAVYTDAINRAIQNCPQLLWRRREGTLITDEGRDYSLATLTEITNHNQLRRVWMETSDGEFAELSRWRVRQDESAVWLHLDEDPPAAGRVLRIEYVAPHETFTCDENDSTVTTLDHEWLICQAAIYLLAEANPQLEEPHWLAQQIQLYDSLRRRREAELSGGQWRPRARKARSRRGMR